MTEFLAWLTRLSDDGLGGVLVILLPLGVLVFLGACAALVWAVRSQQFDNLDVEARRILFETDDSATQPVTAGMGNEREGPNDRTHADGRKRGLAGDRAVGLTESAPGQAAP